MGLLTALLVTAGIFGLLMWSLEQNVRRQEAEQKIEHLKNAQHDEAVRTEYRELLRVLEGLLWAPWIARVESGAGSSDDLDLAQQFWRAADLQVADLDKITAKLPLSARMSALVSFLPSERVEDRGPLIRDYDSGLDRSWRPLMAERDRVIRRRNELASLLAGS